MRLISSRRKADAPLRTGPGGRITRQDDAAGALVAYTKASLHTQHAC
jgi:hypothetical protein